MDVDSKLDEQEELRYIAYFQRQLVREGSEDFLAEQKVWFERNRAQLAADFDAVSKVGGGPVGGVENPFLTHRDATEFDSLYARQIFVPILEKSLQAAAKLGFKIQRPVMFANSPDVEPGACGLPSTDQHTLFIGHGVSTFCNYWSKVFAAAIYDVGSLLPHARTTEAVMESIRSNPILVTALKLVLRYARAESLVGFGELKQEVHLDGFRIEVLRAMETFVVGHELGHFILHEQFPEENGIPPGSSLRDVELICDAYGLWICSEVGEAEGNFSSKHLVGALLFFCALRLCEDGQGILLGVERAESESHPSTKDRIRHLLAFAQQADPSGILLRYLEESLDYALILSLHIKSVLKSVSEEVNA